MGLNATNQLEWVLGTGILDGGNLPKGHENEPDGSVFEISAVRENIIDQISQLLKRNGGVALLIDYGHGTPGFGDTFQAVSQHKYTDPLNDPGKVDLTSHVDFAPFSPIASNAGCRPMPIMEQGEFLLKLGLLERAGALGAEKSHEEQKRITGEAERLALPEEMGELFKVFAISSGPDLWPFVETT